MSHYADALVGGAEIGLDDALVGLDLRRRAFGDLHPVIEDAHPIGDPHHDPHGMLDEQDGDAAFVAHPADEAHHVRAFAGIHAGHRLVQHQQARPGGERPRHLEPPLLAIGEVPRDHVAAAPEPDEVEDAPAHPHGRAPRPRGSPGY